MLYVCISVTLASLRSVKIGGKDCWRISSEKSENQWWPSIRSSVLSGKSPAALQVLLISDGNTAAILKGFVEATCWHFSLTHR